MNHEQIPNDANVLTAILETLQDLIKRVDKFSEELKVIETQVNNLSMRIDNELARRNKWWLFRN